MSIACKRVVVENFFEPCVLTLLMKKPGYGYQLKNDLDERCKCRVNTGNLYRRLAKLQKNGYVLKKKIKGEMGPSKQVYEITKKGKDLLSEWIDELKQEVKTINKLITNYKKTL